MLKLQDMSVSDLVKSFAMLVESSLAPSHGVLLIWLNIVLLNPDYVCGVNIPFSHC